MTVAEDVTPPYVAFFRNSFELSCDSMLRFAYSADERCMMFLDGRRIAEGPERGSVNLWYYNTVEIKVPAGKHMLVARVMCIGKALTAYAQMSVRHGFFIEEESSLLGNNWEYQILECEFNAPAPDWGAFPRIKGGRNFNFHAIAGLEGYWRKAEYFADSRTLHPAMLPPMKYEPDKDFIRYGNIFMFEEYACRWSVMEFSGAGRALIRFLEPACKSAAELPAGDRAGNWDILELTGDTVSYYDYFFRAGRTAEIRLEGSAELKNIEFFRTGYPWKYKVDFSVPDNEMSLLLNTSRRTFEACTFETYMDCPYFEQLLYVGDSRIEALSTYCISDDFRLPEKALKLLASGINDDGVMFARFPAKDFPAVPDFETLKVQPVIPAFTLLYISMVHDYASLRHNDALVKELLVLLRRIFNNIKQYIGSDNLLRMPGWNFIDWVSTWENGTPPGSETGSGCSLNLIAVLALRDLSDLERHFGSDEFSVESAELSKRIESAVKQTFYCEYRGCFAENTARDYFSEHAQVLAMLAFGCTEPVAALRTLELDRCSIYFSFYYLVMCKRFGLTDLFEKRRQCYMDLCNAGLSTLPEEFNNWRSWCHAWSAHWLYHYFSDRSAQKNNQ